MGKIIFVIGGARSGKSTYAFKIAKKKGGRTAFIATCVPQDKEMKQRVALHRNTRPKVWKTFENPKDIQALIKENGVKFGAIILDCLTLLVSGYMMRGIRESDIKTRISKMISAFKKSKSLCIIVSNEVGLGIVPENKLARDFRDIAGRMNQLVAEESDNVFFMVSGLPWRIK